MKRKFHVRFLGGGGGVSHPCYPTNGNTRIVSGFVLPDKIGPLKDETEPDDYWQLVVEGKAHSGSSTLTLQDLEIIKAGPR